jgi:hypothetical protein
MANPRKPPRSPNRSSRPWSVILADPGELGAIRDGQRAAVIYGTAKYPDGTPVNLYAQALKDPGLKPDARKRYIELKKAFRRGYASVPQSKRGKGFGNNRKT